MTTRLKSATGLAALGLSLIATATFTLRAQPPAGRAAAPAPPGDGRLSVQDALSRPFNFPFAKATPLEEVAAFLGRTLNAPVALDRAALDRLDVRTDDTVQLDLQGVRLKTGLKLLLDQLDLTFRVEPEDNLLVITDVKGANDPLNGVLSELKSLHRDVHAIQDDLDDIRAAMNLDGEGGVKMRKPTIIEELPPGAEKEKPKDNPQPSPPKPRRGA